jgi:hypothetical protein
MQMKQHLILWPLLAQVMLVLFMYLRLLIVKKREIAADNVDLKAVALRQELWPDSVLLVNNNLRNQFESPMLFYVLCLVLLGLGAVDISVMGTAAIYVASRYGHAIVHTTSNNVRIRMPLFVVGIVSLVGLVALAVMALVKIS